MKTLLRLLLTMTIAAGALAIPLTPTALADCAETSPDVWECDSTPQDTDGLIVIDGDVDTVTVNADSSVSAAPGTGIFGDAGDTVNNQGVITGDGAGVQLIGGGSSPSAVTNSGDITGGTGNGVFIFTITASTENTVENPGTIDSEAEIGILINGHGESTENTVTNSGEIGGGGLGAVEMNSVGDSVVNTILNSGNITGDSSGVLINTSGEAAINSVTNSGDIVGQNSSGVFINSLGDFASNTIANSGNITGDATGVGISGFGSSVGNATVTNSGAITGNADGVLIGYGNANIYNSGAIESVAGEAIDVEAADSALIVNDGLLISQAGSAILGGGESDGPMTLINNGAIIGNDTGPDDAVVDFWSGDDVIVNNGSIVALSGSRAIDTEAGDDVVILGAGGVSYGTVCGDINVTNVGYHAAVVAGLVDGGDDTDTIIFGFLTPSQSEAEALAAEVAGHGPTGSQTINGQGYSWANFENVRVNATIFSQGATRLYDDGVLLAFATGDGIDVCSGEAGARAGTINFSSLASGQTTFSAGNDGWWVAVQALAGGLYEVHLYDGGGVEHVNDANGDGLADSRFTFTR